MKLPVLKAVKATIGFAGAFWRDLLIISWAPALLCIAASLALQLLPLPSLGNSLLLGMGGTWVRLSFSLPDLFLLLLALVISCAPYALLIAGILRLIIRGERPKSPICIQFGKLELFAFLTALLLVACNLLFNLASNITSAVLAFLSDSIPRVGVPLAFGAGAGAVWIMVRIHLRLSMALPAAVAIGGIGMLPSIHATRENEMHLLGFWLLWAAGDFVLFRSLAIPYVLNGALGHEVTPNPVPAMISGLSDYAWMLAGDVFVGVTRIVTGTLINVVRIALVAVASGIAWRMIHEAGTVPARADDAKSPVTHANPRA